MEVGKVFSGLANWLWMYNNNDTTLLHLHSKNKVQKQQQNLAKKIIFKFLK